MVRNQPAHALERPIHAHLYAAHTLPNTPFIFEVNVLILPCCQESNETRPPFTQRMLKGSDRWNGALAVPPMFQTTTRSYRWAWNFTRWPRAKVPSPCLSFAPVGTKSSHIGGQDQKGTNHSRLNLWLVGMCNKNCRFVIYRQSCKKGYTFAS